MKLKKIITAVILTSMAFSTSAMAAGFTDIEHHWAEEIINNLAAKGVVHGVSDTEFNPDGIVTRAEFLKMVMGAARIDDVAYRSGECLDVIASQWYGGCIQSALDKGLIPEDMIEDFASKVEEEKAVYSGRFNAETPIKREEMAYITQSLYQYTLDEETMDDMYRPVDLQFTDVQSISKWAFHGVQYAYAQDFISGMEDDTFRPQDIATRAQAATIISKLLDRIE